MTSSATPVSIEQLAINTIRTLSMDAVEAANSGHPGTPMALAPVAYSLWNRVLKYDPTTPLWPNRDRFVLSCGHASMLLYSVLHLTGVKDLDSEGKPTGKPAVSLDDIKQFRQWGSKTPGHPEYHHTTGVEVTTGPLGQGCGNSVGLAAASRWLAARYNKPGFKLFDFNVYVLCSDGDLMEGVASEAASLAGHLKLSNLCWIYDNNRITIEGHTSLAFSEDVAMRFQGYGWNTTHVRDANDLDALTTAYQTFKDTPDRPTLIVVDSIIGFGSPNKHDSHEAHGAPLGAEEIKLTKHAYGWPEDAKFLVPPEVPAHFDRELGERGHRSRTKWEALYAEYQKAHPELAAQLELMQAGELPKAWDAELLVFPADAKGIASRSSSGKVMQTIGKKIPWFIGGSADLAPSTKTLLEFDGAGQFEATDYGGRNFHFGIREHAMGAFLNGMATTGIRPYGATFGVFSDYCRPAIRLAAIMGLPSIFIFTHDSIGVGEDGPTHQPIEHLAALRAIPQLRVVRPGDANEVTECWRAILGWKHRPTCLFLTRQNIPTFDRTKAKPATGCAKGAYILSEPSGKPTVILMGTGSEVSLCMAAAEALAKDGVHARVVSMPCWEIFEEQDEAYKASVFPAEITARVAVERASPFGWERYVGHKGKTVTLNHYGASAPDTVLAKMFGFTVENVVAQAKAAGKG